MSLRSLHRTSIRLVVVAAMTAGFSLASVSLAAAQVHPATVNNWYVATTGKNTGRNCSSSSLPCKTIAYALSEQESEAVTGIIHVAKGTYSGQVIVGPSNDGVTIDGAGSSGSSMTVISPGSADLTSDTDTDSSSLEYPIVDVTLGTTGFNVENLQVNGTAGINNIQCGQDYVGIYYHGSGGTISKVSVVGIDLPQGSFGCQGGQGIYVDSLSGDPANVTMKSVNESVPADTTVTTAALPADTYDGHDILPVKKIPSNFVNGQGIVVNGYALTARKDTSKSLYITGTTSTASRKGSLVNYNPYQPAFSKNGITCDDNWTICKITSSTVEGAGPTNLVAQNGIQGYGAEQITLGGATASLGDTVSGFSYAGDTGYVSTAVLLISNGPTLLENNKVSSSDVDVYAGYVPAFGGPPNPVTPGTWTFSDNTISDALCSGTNTSNQAPGCQSGWAVGFELDSTGFPVNVTDNIFTGNKAASITLSGVQDATLNGNDITGTGTDTGITLDGPGSQCYYAYGNDCTYEAGNANQYASEDNTIENNVVGDSGIGSLVLGQYDPSFEGSADTDGAITNAYYGNTWSTNTINVADFSGYGSGNPPQNTYSAGNSYADNSCDPAVGMSTALNADSGNDQQWGC
jgi:hypothetical protein